MNRSTLMGCALALALAACTEAESQCGAACSNSLDVALHRQEWPAGEYVLIARYDAFRRSLVVTCTFTLPGGADAVCDDGLDEYYAPELIIGATVTLALPHAPPRIALELQSPDGESQSLERVPAYNEHELCGSTCRNGSVTASLDEAP